MLGLPGAFLSSFLGFSSMAKRLRCLNLAQGELALQLFEHRSGREAASFDGFGQMICSDRLKPRQLVYLAEEAPWLQKNPKMLI